MEISKSLPLSHPTARETAGSPWRGLYRAGGIAALLAGIVFRRNLAAEISLFSPNAQPASIEGWFALLQNNRLLGLAYLGFFDVLDYALLGLMFLALYAALRRVAQSTMTIALAAGLAGMGVLFASNTSFAMVSLSEQYAAAAPAQRDLLLAAGQAMLALSHNGVGYPGTGIYMSFLLLALAGLLSSIAMLRSNIFSKATAYTGLAAVVIDLTYCVTFAFLPGLTVVLMASAGLLLMVWHIQVGVGLLRMGKEEFVHG
jgi:hypothetical protein